MRDASGVPETPHRLRPRPLALWRGIATIVVFLALPALPIYWGVTVSGPFRWIAMFQARFGGGYVGGLTFLLTFIAWAVGCTAVLGWLIAPAMPPPRPARERSRRRVAGNLGVAVALVASIAVLLAGTSWVTGWITRATAIAPPGRAVTTETPLAVGTSVYVHWHRDWWTARIIGVDGARFRVHYVDYGASDDEWVSRDRIRLTGAR
jgi:hypothetical protein